MSQNPPNYMDGVPVKISERYKPPPKISLPQSLVQRLHNFDINLLANNQHLHEYNGFDLEHKIITKTTEWDAVRQQERYERHVRMRRRQEERLKQIRENQKQMLTAVSYPTSSSSSSSDEEDTATTKTAIKTKPINLSLKKHHVNTLNCFDQKILVPTIFQQPSEQKITTVEQQKQQRLNRHFNVDHFNQNNECSSIKHNTFNKINYSDFENDTSSPFDNIELKTINDLDILAQVLNLTTLEQQQQQPTGAYYHGVDNHNDTTRTRTSQTNISIEQPSSSTTTTRTSSEETTDENITNKNCVVPLQIINIPNSQIIMPSSPSPTNVMVNRKNQNIQFYPSVVDEFSTNTNNPQYTVSQYFTDLIKPLTNEPMIQEKLLSNNEYLITTTKSRSVELPASNYLYSNSSQPKNEDYGTPYHFDNGMKALTMTTSPPTAMVKNTILDQLKQQLKSKSVPDILKELNDEIQDSQQKRRVRNNSDRSTNKEQPTAVATPPLRLSTDRLENNYQSTFHKLSMSAQKLAQNISQMGFPLERVCRITEKFGNDDKKIVEHLIPLSELLDLGFDETNISDALIKFNNNKEKALDFLIS